MSLLSGTLPAPGWSSMAHESRESLGRHRMRLRRNFIEVQTRGTAFRGRHCLLVALPQPGEPSLVGFIASKKGVGGAVQRNRARRRLREIVRRRWPRMPHMGFWLVIVAFRGALTAPHQELASDVEQILARAGALEPMGVGN